VAESTPRIGFPIHQEAPGHDRPRSSPSSAGTQNRRQFQEIEVCARGISELRVKQTSKDTFYYLSTTIRYVFNNNNIMKHLRRHCFHLLI